MASLVKSALPMPLLRDVCSTVPVAVVVIASFTCFVLWVRWLFSSLFYIETIKSCCGRNADSKLSGYDSQLPDAEIIPEAKNRDNTVTVYVAKEIVTMDPTWPTARVVACQYGRILGIGGCLQDLEPWLTRNGLDIEEDVIIDRTFEEHVIVPGFIEQHGHPMIGGTALSMTCVAFHDTVAPYAPMIKGCKKKEDIINRLKEEHRKLPLTDGLAMEEMILAWGFDSVAMGFLLTKEDLDEIDPEGKRCVFVWDCSMHFGFVNTATLERKLGMEVKNGKNNKLDGVETDPKTGELTGAFLGITAIHTYCRCIILPLMKPSRSLQSMHHISEISRMAGITTVSEMLMGVLNIGMELDLYKWFFENEITACRCVCIIDADKVKKSMSPFRLPLPNARANAAARWIRDRQKQSSEKLIFNNGAKFFADDSFLGLTMKLGFPGYVEPKRSRGIWGMESGPGAAFAAEILPFWKAGCRVHVHSNGEASHDAMAEVVQMLQTIHPRFDHRFCLEHYGMSASHIHRKLKNLGVNVSVNVYYALLRAQINEAHLGKDKAHAASRLKSIVDSGLVVAMHADTPVAPPRPLEEIWFACNRMADKLTILSSSSSNARSKSNSKSNWKTINGISYSDENKSNNGNINTRTKAKNGEMDANMSARINGVKTGGKKSSTKDKNATSNGSTDGIAKTSPKATNGTSNGTTTWHTKPVKEHQNLVPICPVECVTPYQAMRMKTIDAAYIHGLDDVIGSIETGKFADFAILEENPLESDKGTLRDIKVIATVIGGVKRMNVPQRRTVPIPPGDHVLGQVFWIRAMNITENGMLTSIRRWMFLKVAAYFGSTGTLEEALLKAKQTAASKTTNPNKATKKKFDPYDLANDGDVCIPIPVCKDEDEEILPSIKAKHVKPSGFLANLTCCRC